MRDPETLARLVNDLMNSTQATRQASDKLNEEALALAASLEASRQVMVLPVVGAGDCFFNANNLTDAEMNRLEAAVHAGDCVLVILDWKGIQGAPLQNGFYHVARVVAMVGDQVLVAPLGTHEQDPQARLTLKNPRHDIWGAYIAPVAEAV